MCIVCVSYPVDIKLVLIDLSWHILEISRDRDPFCGNMNDKSEIV